MFETVQIQIQPVENGFVIQAVNVDGDRMSKRLVEKTRAELVTTMKGLCDLLFTKERTDVGSVAKPTAPPPAT